MGHLEKKVKNETPYCIASIVNWRLFHLPTDWSCYVLQFEEMMDRLEKGSGQQVITLKEAKLLLKEDDDLIMAVYDYWLNKRLRLVSTRSGRPPPPPL